MTKLEKGCLHQWSWHVEKRKGKMIRCIVCNISLDVWSRKIERKLRK